MEGEERIRVLIVDDIAETRENLRKLLSFAPDIEVVGAAGTGEEGVRMAKEVSPHVVLMDINLPGMDGITATEHIVREVPTAQIVILSVQGETGYMRRAMAAGARDFLVKPPSGDELMNTIRRVYEIGQAQAARIAPPPTLAGAAGPGPFRQGQLVAVFGPKGGAGCTTVAVNLAVALQTRLGPSQKVAVMDANVQFGDVGVMLNLQASRSIADLADRLDELDADLLTSVLAPHPSGIKALLAPPHPEAAEMLMAGDSGSGPPAADRTMRAIIKALLREFDPVVADTWSWVDDLTLSVLDEASLILLVVTPLIPDIKDGRHFLDLASRLNYPPEKLALVINQADRRTGIRPDQIERALIPALGHIPFDERGGILAANRGMPMVTEEAGKPVAQAFVQLSAAVLERLAALAGREQEEAESLAAAETGRRMLGRVFGY